MCLHPVEPFLNILLQLFFRPLTCQFDIEHRRQISTIEFHGTDKKVRLLQGIRTWSEEMVGPTNKAMGRAIVRNPKVFLMDEPLSNLDAKLRVQMRIEISKLHENLGATIIYVTHDQTEAMTLGTRIVVMKDGVVQQVDTPQNLYNTPCNLFVAGFIGSPQMNFMDAVCSVKGDDVTLTVGKHVLKVPASKKQALINGNYDGKTVVLGIRPEDVHDSQAFISNSPDSIIESEIKVYELLGAEVFLYFDVEGTQMTARVNPRTTLRTGDKAVFALDMEKIHVFDKETELTITN